MDPEEIRTAVRDRHRRRGQGHRQGHGPGAAGVQGPRRRQVDQPDRARGAAGGLMSQSPFVSPHGVPAHEQGGTPSPLPPEQCADALETIEFDQVVELVARHAVGPLGAERVHARRPTDDLEWIIGELARVGEVAALLAPGRRAAGGADPGRDPRARPASHRGERARGHPARRPAADAGGGAPGAGRSPARARHGAARLGARPAAARQAVGAAAGAVGGSRGQPARHRKPAPCGRPAGSARRPPPPDPQAGVAAPRSRLHHGASRCDR